MDGNILLWIQENLRNDILTPVMHFITSLGDRGYIWIVLALILLISKKTRRIGLLTLFALLLAHTLNNVCIKGFIQRTRPYEKVPGLTSLLGTLKSTSFPSGHTASSIAAAAVLYKSLPKAYGIPALILAGLIAFSRMYMGVHYPTDILGGILVGTVSALFVLGMDTYFQKNFKRIFQRKSNS